MFSFHIYIFIHPWLTKNSGEINDWSMQSIYYVDHVVTIFQNNGFIKKNDPNCLQSLDHCTKWSVRSLLFKILSPGGMSISTGVPMWPGILSQGFEQRQFRRVGNQHHNQHEAVSFIPAPKWEGRSEVRSHRLKRSDCDGWRQQAGHPAKKSNLCPQALGWKDTGLWTSCKIQNPNVKFSPQSTMLLWSLGISIYSR